MQNIWPSAWPQHHGCSAVSGYECCKSICRVWPQLPSSFSSPPPHTLCSTQTESCYITLWLSEPLLMFSPSPRTSFFIMFTCLKSDLYFKTQHLNPQPDVIIFPLSLCSTLVLPCAHHKSFPNHYCLKPCTQCYSVSWSESDQVRTFKKFSLLSHQKNLVCVWILSSHLMLAYPQTGPQIALFGGSSSYQGFPFCIFQHLESPRTSSFCVAWKLLI